MAVNIRYPESRPLNTTFWDIFKTWDEIKAVQFSRFHWIQIQVIFSCEISSEYKYKHIRLENISWIWTIIGLENISKFKYYLFFEKWPKSGIWISNYSLPSELRNVPLKCLQPQCGGSGGQPFNESQRCQSPTVAHPLIHTSHLDN